MADEVTQSSPRVDRVGRSGIYPASGPLPSGDYMIRGQGELGHPEEHARITSFRRSGAGQTAMLLAGRLIVGGYFLYNGINHFRNREMLAGYAKSKEVPAPDVAVIGTGALATLGGLSVLTGYKPKLGASMLSTFLLGISPQMHDFWNIEDPAQQAPELINFSKNMALVGAACFIAAMPEPWPLSIRGRSEAMVAA